MLLGLVTDIHDHVEPLARALELFRQRGVDLVVTLGDSCDAFTRHSRAAEVVELFRGAGAVGVWGHCGASGCPASTRTAFARPGHELGEPAGAGPLRTAAASKRTGPGEEPSPTPTRPASARRSLRQSRSWS